MRKHTKKRMSVSSDGKPVCDIRSYSKWFLLAVLYGAVVATTSPALVASDHLDATTVRSEPAVDIADLYAWMSPDAQQLNLAMTIFGHAFSTEHEYVFHIDSGTAFGSALPTTRISCRFESPEEAECRIQGSKGNGGLRTYAGLRDDPFFNNVKGTRAALSVAVTAINSGAALDAAGCPVLDPKMSDQVLKQWRKTDGLPGSNFLAGWKVASLIVSVDLDAIAIAGPFVAVWSATYTIPHGHHGKRQIDRIGRPLTGNGLLGLLASTVESDRLKEEYNASESVESWEAFENKIRAGLAIYDGLDGVCGNQWLASPEDTAERRYEKLAAILTDDRIWIDSRVGRCGKYLAVELASTVGGQATIGDCGGRTPTDDATDTLRSLLVMGRVTGVTDGVNEDDAEHSLEIFPFFAAPKGRQ